MATKKQSTEQEIAETETKVIGLLMNEPSDGIILKSGEKVIFQRPTLPMKYRYQVWLNNKLQEIGLDTVDSDSEFFMYFNYYGLLNAHIVKMFVKNDKDEYVEYTYSQKEDLDCKFVFEKYVMREVYEKNKSDEEFVLDVIDKFTEWQSYTSVGSEELKNS